MKKYDKYDILISSMGFHIDGITDKIIDKHQDEIFKLKEELGIIIENDQFNLILFDDMDHTHLEVMSDMIEIGLGDRSMEIIREAELTGRVILMSGHFTELKKFHKKLRKENYRTVLRRIEKE